MPDYRRRRRSGLFARWRAVIGQSALQPWRLPSGVVWLTAAGVLLAVSEAEARVGGGQSYSGSRNRGGGGGGGGGEVEILFWLLRLVFYYPQIGIPLLIVAVAVFWYLQRHGEAEDFHYSSGSYPHDYAPAGVLSPAVEQAILHARVDQAFEQLREYDPNFSLPAFLDFADSLYSRVQESRGRGDLPLLTSYLSPEVVAELQAKSAGLRQVTGVIVGTSEIIRATSPQSDARVTLVVRYETNYTEVDADGRPQSYYAVETWHFTRRRDALSPTPERITLLRCPKCGGALDKKPDGSCAYCGVKIQDGDYHWYVSKIHVVEREARPPLLTSDVPEEGTEYPTVYQPGLDLALQRFRHENPDFSWERAEERFRHTFLALQEAWTTQRWEAARPFETDHLFQSHRYWMEAYRKQGLRNVLEDIHIEYVTPVKVQSDAFYDAFTVRMGASLRDYTVDLQGKVVSGSPKRARRFSEYWTFIRRKGVPENHRPDSQCPSCGAPLRINMAGTCEYCSSKVTSGYFTWVLSRIQQDEAYRG